MTICLVVLFPLKTVLHPLFCPLETGKIDDNSSTDKGKALGRQGEDDDTDNKDETFLYSKMNDEREGEELTGRYFYV